MSAKTIAPTAPRMPPAITPANRPFWTGGADGELRLWRNKRSGKWLSPFDKLPTDTSDWAPTAASGKGTIFAYTVDYHQYHPDVPPPYVVALVELAEQADLRLPTNIVNCAFEDLRIGMPVRVVFEQQGEVFFPLFEPEV